MIALIYLKNFYETCSAAHTRSIKSIFTNEKEALAILNGKMTTSKCINSINEITTNNLWSFQSR